VNLHSLQKANVCTFPIVDYRATKQQPPHFPPTFRRQAQQLNYVTVKHVVVATAGLLFSCCHLPPTPCRQFRFGPSFFSSCAFLFVPRHTYTYTRWRTHAHNLGLHKRELALFSSLPASKKMCNLGIEQQQMFTKPFCRLVGYLACKVDLHFNKKILSV